MVLSPRAVDQPYLILGEGRRDQLFLQSLANHKGITGIQFEGSTGYTGFANSLKGAWSSRTGFDRLNGLVLVGDNDPNEGKTFRSIRDQLQNAGIASPAKPLTIARRQDSPAVAVIMMPFDGTDTLKVGALESLLLPAIEHAHPKETQCYDAMFHCVGADQWPSPSSRDKLKVRCILSSCSPSNPMCGVETWFSPNNPLIPLDWMGFDGITKLLTRLDEWFKSGIDEWLKFNV
jgi:hypothetical protein